MIWMYYEKQTDERGKKILKEELKTKNISTIPIFLIIIQIELI